MTKSLSNLLSFEESNYQPHDEVVASLINLPLPALETPKDDTVPLDLSSSGPTPATGDDRNVIFELSVFGPDSEVLNRNHWNVFSHGRRGRRPAIPDYGRTVMAGLQDYYQLAKQRSLPDSEIMHQIKMHCHEHYLLCSEALRYNSVFMKSEIVSDIGSSEIVPHHYQLDIPEYSSKTLMSLHDIVSSSNKTAKGSDINSVFLSMLCNTDDSIEQISQVLQTLSGFSERNILLSTMPYSRRKEIFQLGALVLRYENDDFIIDCNCNLNCSEYVSRGCTRKGY